MDRKYWDNTIKYWFKLPKHTKIRYFKNPNECSKLQLEMVNPTHKGILWGQRTKKYKHKGKNPIRIGEITITNIMLFMSNLYDQLIYSIETVLQSTTLPIAVLYIFLSITLICFVICMPNMESIMLIKRG